VESGKCPLPVPSLRQVDERSRLLPLRSQLLRGVHDSCIDRVWKSGAALQHQMAGHSMLGSKTLPESRLGLHTRPRPRRESADNQPQDGLRAKYSVLCQGAS
jgi:hypothetical protein